MRYFFLIVFSLALFGTTQAQLPARLSPAAEISVLTCAPGDQMYSMYGHSAVRVQDSQIGFDRVYNYGTFNFQDPDFLMKFVRGKLEYYLQSYGMRAFKAEYTRDRRHVSEQVLNLTQEEVQAIYDALNENELPQNRAYQYDFFFDNCATRERDILETVLGENVRFKAMEEGKVGSLRDLIGSYMPHIPWTAFGINLLLSKQADQAADRRSAMFLPDYLHSGIAVGEVRHNGAWEPLVRADRTLLEIPILKLEGGGFFTPGLVFGLLFLFVAIASFTAVGKHPAFRIFDFLLFFIVGALGTLMLFFWLATDHQSTYMNFNMLWALPTHLLFAFLIVVPKWKNPIYHYSRISLIISTLFLLTSWWLLPQSTPGPAYALLLTLYFRLAWYGIQAADG